MKTKANNPHAHFEGISLSISLVVIQAVKTYSFMYNTVFPHIDTEVLFFSTIKIITFYLPKAFTRATISCRVS